MIDALGPDILRFHVLPLLNFETLVSLGLVNRTLAKIVFENSVWHWAYLSHFPDVDPIAPDDNWETACRIRVNRATMAWGETQGGRIGILPVQSGTEGPRISGGPQAPAGVVIMPFRRHWTPMTIHPPVAPAAYVHVPTEIKGFDGLAQIAIGGFYSAGLRLDGSVLITGDFNDTRSQRAVSLHKLTTGKRFSEENEGRHIGPPIFRRISAGRQHLVAVDTFYNVWQWAQSREEPGVQLKGVTAPQVIAGWSFSIAFGGEAGGATVWWKDDLVPVRILTSKTVSSAAAGGDFLAVIIDSRPYILEAGDAKQLKTAELCALPEFGSKNDAKFVCATHNRLLIVTEDGRVVVARRAENRFELEPPRLSGIVEAAAGDYHNLARDSEGYVWAWGSEPKGCGALGLGNPDDIVAKGGRRNESSFSRLVSVDVDEPLRVNLRAFNVSAGGWQSGAIAVSQARPCE